jgi:hypothetical protein
MPEAAVFGQNGAYYVADRSNLKLSCGNKFIKRSNENTKTTDKYVIE